MTWGGNVMKQWIISSNGREHHFDSWREASKGWEAVKKERPGDATVRHSNGTVIDFA